MGVEEKAAKDLRLVLSLSVSAPVAGAGFGWSQELKPSLAMATMESGGAKPELAGRKREIFSALRTCAELELFVDGEVRVCFLSGRGVSQSLKIYLYTGEGSQMLTGTE